VIEKEECGRKQGHRYCIKRESLYACPALHWYKWFILFSKAKGGVSALEGAHQKCMNEYVRRLIHLLAYIH